MNELRNPKSLKYHPLCYEAMALFYVGALQRDQKWFAALKKFCNQAAFGAAAIGLFLFAMKCLRFFSH